MHGLGLARVCVAGLKKPVIPHHALRRGLVKACTGKDVLLVPVVVLVRPPGGPGSDDQIAVVFGTTCVGNRLAPDPNCRSGPVRIPAQIDPTVPEIAIVWNDWEKNLSLFQAQPAPKPFMPSSLCV